MQWERAKNLILLFFILLNITLMVLLRLEHHRYTMTSEREQLIHSVLARNQIEVQDSLIRQFPPMRALNISGFNYNTDELINILFDNPTLARRIDNYDGPSIYEDRVALLVISTNGFITFDNPQGFRQIREGMHPADKQERARFLSDAFIQRYFPDFKWDTTLTEGEGFRLSYRQVYRGYVIYTNFIELLVTDIGIEQIEMQFGRVHGWATGTERTIFAPDEALLTFMRRIRNITDAPVFVRVMDRVYYQENRSASHSIYQAIPVYRIFIRDNDHPFLINAYTNQFIN